VVIGDLSLGVKWPGHGVDQSLPSCAKVTNKWSYTSTTPPCLHGMHMDTFTLPYKWTKEQYRKLAISCIKVIIITPPASQHVEQNLWLELHKTC